MDARKYLSDKGYDPQTKNAGMGWMCTLEVNMRVQTFHGVNEKVAMERAVEYVVRLEECFAEQQMRLRCEGCGEG